MRLVSENKDQVEQSFKTYHGRLSSGYDSAESRSFDVSPSGPMTSSPSVSRQSRFSSNDNKEDDNTVETHHSPPFFGSYSRDFRRTSRDGPTPPQYPVDPGESMSLSSKGASSGSFGDGGDPSRDSRGVGKYCGRSHGRRNHDGCGDFVGDGSSCSVGPGGFRPRAVPRDLSAIASSDIIVSKLMRCHLSHRDYVCISCAATEPPDEKYLIGRLQVDHESFENANRLADFVSNYQLCLAKLRERIIQFDLKDSTIVYSNVDVNSSVVSGHSYDLIDDHEKLDFDMVLQWQHWHNLWAFEVDIESSTWMTRLLFNSLKPDFHDEVYREFMELPIEHRGSASALWIALDRVYCSSFELTQALKNFIHTFQLSSYPNENVGTACLQFKTIFKALYDANGIPPQSATIMLKGYIVVKTLMVGIYLR